MRVSLIIVIISLVWAISEIILAITKRSQTKESKESDKSSLRFLWITILTSIFLGIYLGLKGIGLVLAEYHFIPILGMLLIILGLSVRWIAIFTLKKYFTVNVAILSNHKIIQRGIYRYVRHPAYTGSLLSFLGLGISFSNWLSTAVIFLPILVAFIYRIEVEEKALTEAFRDEYLNYCKVTKRLIPKIY